MLDALIMAYFGLRCEGSFIRQQLTPELRSGPLIQQEYGTLGSVGGRIGSSFRAVSRGGFGGWRTYSRRSRTATELAFHRDRVAWGMTAVDAARHEAAYVRLPEDSKGR